MRRLFPEPTGPVGLAEAYAVEGDPSSHLRVNMVSSVDGAAVVAGRVGALTGPADQRLLVTLRALAEVVLVGAGTVRAEGYGSLALPEPWRRHRTDGGRSAQPRLAVVSGRLDLDLGAPVFTAASDQPIVVTSAAATASRRAATSEVAELVVAGQERVDLRAAVAALTERGLGRILSEGGPQVLGQLIADDLVDELCLTLSPVVAGGRGTRIVAGADHVAPKNMRLAQVCEEDEFMFLRYRR